MINEDIEKNLKILQDNNADTPVTYVIREMMGLNSQLQNKEIDENEYQIKTTELWNKSKEIEQAYSIKFYRTYDGGVFYSSDFIGNTYNPEKQQEHELPMHEQFTQAIRHRSGFYP